MADVKISAGADPGTVVATDKVPMARSASTTAYAATMAELATYANGAYVPNYYTGSPSMDGTGAAGTVSFVSRGDHVHPSDTARVAKAGDTMGGFLTLNANPTANLHAATKQYVDGSAPVGGPYLSVAAMHDVGRNLIHNAGFAVAQRGAGPFTTAVMTLDRWRTAFVLDTISVAQSPAVDANRAAVGDESVEYVLVNTFTGNAGASAFNMVRQHIENVRRLAGKTVTVSFWAWSGSGTPKFGASIDQTFGTGGSPSTAVSGTGSSVTLSTTPTRYTATFVVPSVAGKTLGTNNDNATVLNLWYSCGTTNAALSGSVGVQSGVIAIWGVQLEIGSVATPLEKRDPVLEVQQCQRFYQTGNAVLFGYNATAAAVGFSLPIVPMRAIPTVTVPSNSNSNVSGFGMPALNAASIYPNGTVTATGGFAINCPYTASADL